MSTNHELTLEDLRPREWSVTWEEQKTAGGTRWWGEDRLWPTEDEAVAHARALVAMGNATGEIRSVVVSSRCTKLDATEWEEIQWSHDA